MSHDVGKRVERRLKRLAFGMAARRTSIESEGVVPLEAIRRVLVVRANFRLGNLLLLTPALAAIREALPWARIDVLADETYLDLLAGHPAVDSRIGVSRRALRDPFLAVRLASDLRRQRYDLAIDGGRGSSFLGAATTFLSRARYRVATSRCRYARFFNVFVKGDAESLHKVDLLLGMLRGLGIPPVTRELTIALTCDEARRAQDRCRAMGVPAEATLVGINLGARGSKRWSTDAVCELVQEIRRRSLAEVVLLAGPEDRDRLLEVYPELPKGSAFVAPLMSIRDFAALLSRLTLLVTGDTGPMHVAAAVGTPTVGLFVAEASRYFRPLGPQHRVVFGQTDETDVSGAIRAVTDVLWRVARDGHGRRDEHRRGS